MSFSRNRMSIIGESRKHMPSINIRSCSNTGKRDVFFVSNYFIEDSKINERLAFMTKQYDLFVLFILTSTKKTNELNYSQEKWLFLLPLTLILTDINVELSSTRIEVIFLFYFSLCTLVIFVGLDNVINQYLIDNFKQEWTLLYDR
jgi:hypothetical protein